MSDTLKPYHWGKAEARFFVAQDDVENRGWGVFEMGADVPILFWCASKTDAETAALRLNHINEQFLTCRRSQLDPKPLDTGGVEGGGAVVLLRELVKAIDTYGEQRLQYWPETVAAVNYLTRLDHTTEKPTDSMGGEKDKEYVDTETLRNAEIVEEYAAANAPGSVTESVASDGWRSIDSAPKDGTEILAYNDADEYGIAEWSPEDDGWQFASSEGVEYEGVTLVAWKPLDPPTVGEKEAATEANSVTPQGAQD